jgi:hypothetical protein
MEMEGDIGSGGAFSAAATLGKARSSANRVAARCFIITGFLDPAGSGR